MTVTRDGPHWYISVQVEREVPDPAPARESSAGIDLGVSRFLTLCDGSFTEPLDAFRRKSQSRFECENCGLKINAYHNAAINIATLGQRGYNACGDEGLPSSTKQEPPGNGDRVSAPA